MGRDKAWLTIDGRVLIERVLDAAQPIVDRLLVVIDPATPHREEYQALCRRWNAFLLDDRQPGSGPLGGIETALADCSRDASALVLACDMPSLTSAMLDRLRTESAAHPGEIIVPLDGEGRLQPLVAVYPAACLGTISAQLAGGRRRVDLLFDCFPTRRLPFAAISSLPGADGFFYNVNTPEEIASPVHKW